MMDLFFSYSAPLFHLSFSLSSLHIVYPTTSRSFPVCFALTPTLSLSQFTYSLPSSSSGKNEGKGRSIDRHSAQQPTRDTHMCRPACLLQADPYSSRSQSIDIVTGEKGGLPIPYGCVGQSNENIHTQRNGEQGQVLDLYINKRQEIRAIDTAKKWVSLTYLLNRVNN